MSDTALLAGLAALSGIALLLLGVVIAYREGKRIGSLTRGDQFDRLPSTLRLGGTEWLVRYTEYGAGGCQEHRAWMRFRQYESRVIGDGEDFSGRRWSAEGAVFDDQLCYVYLDRGISEQSLGVVMVELRGPEEMLEGLRCVWSEDRKSVVVQPIRLVPARSGSSPMVPERDQQPGVRQRTVVPSGDTR